MNPQGMRAARIEHPVEIDDLPAILVDREPTRCDRNLAPGSGSSCCPNRRRPVGCVSRYNHLRPLAIISQRVAKSALKPAMVEAAMTLQW